MKKTKLYITSFLLMATISFVPALSFAKDNKNENDNGNKKAKVVQITKEKEDKNSNSVFTKVSDSNFRNPSNPKSNSIFNRLWARFFGNRATATTTSTVPTINTSLVPNISGIKAPTLLKVGEIGTWTVNASDPQNGSLTYSVDWGEKLVAQPLSRMAPQSIVQTSTFTHAYTNEGVYTITFTVSNDAGLKTTSTVNVHVKGVIIQAPVISNFTATSNRPYGALLTWTTDVPSTSFVWYSLTSPVSTSGNPNVAHYGGITNHQINLGQLQPNTKYYVVVGSANTKGGTTSSETSFTTLPVTVNTAPVITSLTKSATTIPVGQTEVVTINAYDPQNSSLSYGADWGDTTPSTLMPQNLNVQPIFIQTSTFSHIYNTPGTYTATFTVQNSAGLKTSSSIVINVTAIVDTTAPIISNTQVSASANTATISWVTNELSTSNVFYSTTTPVNVTTAPSVINGTLVINHTANLTGLTANTTYHFIIKSSDALNNSTTPLESTFITGAFQ